MRSVAPTNPDLIAAGLHSKLLPHAAQYRICFLGFSAASCIGGASRQHCRNRPAVESLSSGNYRSRPNQN